MHNDFELDMPCLVTEHSHAEQQSKAAAKQGDKQQRTLRYAPSAFSRAAFIRAAQSKARDVENQYIYTWNQKQNHWHFLVRTR
jgi:hypothetical protein